MSNFYNPVHLYFDKTGVDQLAEQIKHTFSHVQNVLLLTRGQHAEQHETLKPILEQLNNKNVLLKPCTISNPNLADIVQLAKECAYFDYELVISVGGGSVLDITKALIATKSQVLTDTASLRSIIVEQKYHLLDLAIPWIGIPTTSGTGSELTKWATIWDTELDLKYSISHEQLYAHSALIVPELTQNMPLSLSVITSLDALCHATEAYWSIHSNPITRVYALQAIKKIITYLPQLKANPSQLETRKQLALASAYAGMAFSNTATTACHSISYPLTLLFGVEHGIAASITLGSVFVVNAPKIVELELLLEAFEVNQPEEVEQKIFAIYDHYQLPTKLSTYGLTENRVADVVDGAYTKGRMSNNPVVLSKEMLVNILTKLL